jgi:hypothetical protein
MQLLPIQVYRRVTNRCLVCFHKKHVDSACSYGRKICNCPAGRMHRKFDTSLLNLFYFKTILPKSRDRMADGKIITEWEYEKRHMYIKKLKSRPVFYEICKKKPPRHLANTDHKYDIKRLDSWWYVCYSCHFRWDFDHGLRISMKFLPDILKYLEKSNDIQ